MTLIISDGPAPKGSREVNRWPYKWGFIGLAILGGFTAARINVHYRRKLKLVHFGWISTAVPVIMTPAIMCAGLHVQLVTSPLIINEIKCPLCLESRAALIQTVCTVFYPVLLSPIVNVWTANRLGTYRLPAITNVRGHVSLWWKFTKPLSRTILTAVLYQSFVGILLTHFEAKSLHLVNTKLENLKYN